MDKNKLFRIQFPLALCESRLTRKWKCWRCRRWFSAPNNLTTFLSLSRTNDYYRCWFIGAEMNRSSDRKEKSEIDCVDCFCLTRHSSPRWPDEMSFDLMVHLMPSALSLRWLFSFVFHAKSFGVPKVTSFFLIAIVAPCGLCSVLASALMRTTKLLLSIRYYARRRRRDSMICTKWLSCVAPFFIVFVVCQLETQKSS